MRQLFVLLILIIAIVTTPAIVFAQGMMGSTSSPQVGTQSAGSSDGHTAREEAEGKAIWEKLQAKQLDCKNLTDDNYGSLGEYFMGQMAGSSHEAMNNMMTQMMGEEGEEQMHVVMGKRLSGCLSDAQVPSSGVGFMPMMWMVGGGANSMMGFGNIMGWSAFGFLGLLTWVIWVVVLVDLILLGVLLWKKIKKEK